MKCIVFIREIKGKKQRERKRERIIANIKINNEWK
jgi:hypothetical protein